MPDAKGKLTADERKLIEAWCTASWTSGSCPMSGHKEWVVGDELVQTMAFIPNAGIRIGGQTFPLVIMMCKGCGYTVLLNAIMIGLLSAAPEVQPAQEGQPHG